MAENIYKQEQRVPVAVDKVKTNANTENFKPMEEPVPTIIKNPQSNQKEETNKDILTLTPGTTSHKLIVGNTEDLLASAQDITNNVLAQV